MVDYLLRRGGDTSLASSWSRSCFRCWRTWSHCRLARGIRRTGYGREAWRLGRPPRRRARLWIRMMSRREIRPWLGWLTGLLASRLLTERAKVRSIPIGFSDLTEISDRPLVRYWLVPLVRPVRCCCSSSVTESLGFSLTWTTRVGDYAKDSGLCLRKLGWPRSAGSKDEVVEPKGSIYDLWQYRRRCQLDQAGSRSKEATRMTTNERGVRRGSPDANRKVR